MQVLKLLRSTALIVTSLASAGIAHAQAVGAPAEPPRVATVEISPAKGHAHVGDRMKFKVIAKDAARHSGGREAFRLVRLAVRYRRCGCGRHGAVSPAGELCKSARVVGGKPGVAEITVDAPQTGSVEAWPLTGALPVGASVTLGAPPHARPMAIRAATFWSHWTSKNPAISRKVNDAGLVTGVAPGSATLVAKADDKTSEVIVKVVADTIQKLAIEPSATTAKTGDVVRFTAKAEGGTRKRPRHRLDGRRPARHDLSGRRICGRIAGHVLGDRDGREAQRRHVRGSGIRRNAQRENQLRGAHSDERSPTAKCFRLRKNGSLEKICTSPRFSDPHFFLRHFGSRESEAAGLAESGCADRQRSEYYARRKSGAC